MKLCTTELQQIHTCEKCTHYYSTIFFYLHNRPKPFIGQYRQLLVHLNTCNGYYRQYIILYLVLVVHLFLADVTLLCSLWLHYFSEDMITRQTSLTSREWMMRTSAIVGKLQVHMQIYDSILISMYFYVFSYQCTYIFRCAIVMA